MCGNDGDRADCDDDGDANDDDDENDDDDDDDDDDVDGDDDDWRHTKQGAQPPTTPHRHYAIRSSEQRNTSSIEFSDAVLTRGVKWSLTGRAGEACQGRHATRQAGSPCYFPELPRRTNPSIRG
ncbi:hypothetical protein E2C01_093039 [Portunus trituberculatus]|uniref:Uncharacterized protein n=1 Tax=Portunus trituberculatus TaxID=210409 RepID=A0A5B7JNS6_PORTR|nr:hypothetical protein [Portunus trituberculatus]